jgi:hypothetical protein
MAGKKRRDAGNPSLVVRMSFVIQPRCAVPPPAD